jgi:hypothetical protein
MFVVGFVFIPIGMWFGYKNSVPLYYYLLPMLGIAITLGYFFQVYREYAERRRIRSLKSESQWRWANDTGPIQWTWNNPPTDSEDATLKPLRWENYWKDKNATSDR